MANDEWISPPWIIDLARGVLGGTIDLDPASSDAANASVQAKVFYTQEKPCKIPWTGTVWCNPPYSRGLISDFVGQFCFSKQMTAGLLLVNADTSAGWFHDALLFCHAVCLLRKRVAFISRETWKPVKGNRAGQAVFYRGPYADGFGEVFNPHGFVISLKGKQK